MRPDDQSTLDYVQLVKESRRLDPAACAARVKMAILADCSTQHLVPLLKTLFARGGVAAEVLETEFGTIRQQAAADDGPLRAFAPDFILILNSPLALREAHAGFPGSTEEFVARMQDEVEGVWDALSTRTQATLIQSNLAVPCDRLFGNFEAKANASLPVAALELNRRLAESARARRQVLILDVEHLSSYWGRRRWLDEKMWALAKAFCAMDCLPLVARAVTDVVRACHGGGVKCVVVDLDNTLWGGTIGDDGVQGIQIGHLGGGEAYLTFQRYLLQLKRRGIVLAVCSRNDPKIAVLPFREHAEMALKEEDFAVFVANWANKADNLKSIRDALGIRLDAIAFLDDDPFERNLVRRLLPEVVVPELPAEPADYVKSLAETGLFEAASLSEEDRRRSDMYREQSRRDAARRSFTSTEDYLRSLNMRLALKRFDAFHLPRIAQLIGRSNQFNLTTRRYSEAECQRFMEDRAGGLPLYASLRDDLGDSGLIAAVVLRYRGADLEIDAWLMSCRVLLRGVEDAMMNAVVSFARAHGFKSVRGLYLPTAKNAMAADFYARYGFARTGERSDGGVEWALETGGYAERPTFFAAIKAELAR